MGTKRLSGFRGWRPKHIFCLEGEWWGDLKKPSTVRPVFELVAQIHTGLRFIHRVVGTRAEFDHYLRIWSQRRFDDYPILYLAFHGSDRTLHVGDQRRSCGTVDIDEVSDVLSGCCRRRLVHFDSCGTVGCDARHLKRFLQVTGAEALCGYKGDVDWILSAAFEVVLLSELQAHAFTRRGIGAIDRRVRGDAGQLASALGFRLVVE